MADQTLTDSGRKRLEYLRKNDPSHYSVEGNTWGYDATEAVGLQIDPTGWVVDTKVARINDEMRSPDGLEKIMRDAYSSAEIVRLVNCVAYAPDLKERAARGQELLDGKRQLKAPPMPPQPRIAIQTQVFEVPLRPLEVPDRDRTFHGSSQQGEVTIGVRRGNGLVDLTVDEAWLVRTDHQMLRFALKEAFAAAYDEGEQE